VTYENLNTKSNQPDNSSLTFSVCCEPRPA
jgi:hypothetical protein